MTFAFYNTIICVQCRCHSARDYRVYFLGCESQRLVSYSLDHGGSRLIILAEVPIFSHNLLRWSARLFYLGGNNTSYEEHHKRVQILPYLLLPWEILDSVGLLTRIPLAALLESGPHSYRQEFNLKAQRLSQVWIVYAPVHPSSRSLY